MDSENSKPGISQSVSVCLQATHSDGDDDSEERIQVCTDVTSNATIRDTDTDSAMVHNLEGTSETSEELHGRVAENSSLSSSLSVLSVESSHKPTRFAISRRLRSFRGFLSRVFSRRTNRNDTESHATGRTDDDDIEFLHRSIDLAVAQFGPAQSSYFSFDASADDLRLPEVVDFSSKTKYFRALLYATLPPGNDQFQLHVQRSRLLSDSFERIMPGNAEPFRNQLKVRFINEAGIDNGGLLREWFSELSSQLFNPNYGLFQYCLENSHAVQINPNSQSAVGDEEMDLFRLAGRFMGLAVYHQQLLNVTFAPQFCRALLGKPISLDDVKSFDLQLYNSFKYILDNDSSTLELTFSVTEDQQGKCVQHDLIPNGHEVAVTEDNKHEYVQALIDHQFVAAVHNQTEALRNAFYELVPEFLLQIFDEYELCLLFGGEANIDVQDWRKNTCYSDGYSDKHCVVVWFWQAVTSFTAAQRSQLLRFVTGCSRLPAAGFIDLRGSGGPQRFQLAKSELSNHLPRAHTCFNRLDLPEYKTYKELRSKLLMAVEDSDVIDGVD